MNAEQTLRYQELLDEYDLLLGPAEDDASQLMRNVMAHIMVIPTASIRVSLPTSAEIRAAKRMGV